MKKKVKDDILAHFTLKQLRISFIKPDLDRFNSACTMYILYCFRNDWKIKKGKKKKQSKLH